MRRLPIWTLAIAFAALTTGCELKHRSDDYCPVDDPYESGTCTATGWQVCDIWGCYVIGPCTDYDPNYPSADGGIAPRADGGGWRADSGPRPTDGGVSPRDGGTTPVDGGVVTRDGGGTQTSCQVDGDCASGESCCNGLCTAPNRPAVCSFDSQCGAGRTCVNAQCTSKCTSSANCGTGQVCSAAGRCITNPSSPLACVYDLDCGQSGSCINGTCHAACISDASCQSKDMCDQGICKPDYRPKAECHANSDCSGGKECVNAVCRLPCQQTSDCCATCADRPVCKSGYCTPQNEVSPQCTTNMSCSSGKQCVNASCTN